MIGIIVEDLIKKYKTRNPIEIAKRKNIIILYENLGSEINGYYNKILRQKFIHVNYNLPQHLQLLTIAHELGHALLHPDTNTPFLKNNTFLLVDKMEIEANDFAMFLLISNSELEEYIKNGYTLDNIANIYGYDKKLIDLRIKHLKKHNLGFGAIVQNCPTVKSKLFE